MSISQLPDDLLLEILSWLPDTKSRAQTSLLGKRWRHLWNHNPNVELNPSFTDDVDGHGREGYIRAVDHALSACRAPVLQCLKIGIWELDSYDFPDANALACVEAADHWIRLAGLRSVRQLHIAGCVNYKKHKREPPLPSSIFSSSFSSAMSVLHLSDCSLSSVPCSFQGFSSLTSLTLSSVYTNELALADLLSKCPSLESLDLSYLSTVHYVILSSKNHPKLKHLFITRIWPGKIIEIDAPHLQTLLFHGNLQNLCLAYSPSLAEATLLHHVRSINSTSCDDWMRLAPSVSRTQFPLVDDWFFQHYTHRTNSRVVVFKSLIRLHFNVHYLTVQVLQGLVAFLGECTSLEELHINLLNRPRKEVLNFHQEIESTLPVRNAPLSLWVSFLYQNLQDVEELHQYNLSDYLESFKNSLKRIKKVAMEGYMGTTNEAWLKSMLEQNISSEKLSITYFLRPNLEETLNLLHSFSEINDDVFVL